MQLRADVAVAIAQASSCSTDWTPSPGTSICCRCGPKKQKKKSSASIKYAWRKSCNFRDNGKSKIECEEFPCGTVG